MIKKGFLLIVIILPCFLASYSQYEEVKPVKYFSNDFLILEFNQDFWLKGPSNVSYRLFSPGFNLLIMNVFLGKHSNVCMATGVGFHAQNVHSDSYLEPFPDHTELIKIADSIDYKTNKLTTNYADFLLELRIRTNPNHKKQSLKICIGAKAGYQMNNHTKYVGFDIDNPRDKTKIKQYNIDFVRKYRYGILVRTGYGKIGVNAFYSLTELFESGKGPVLVPFTVGVSLALF